MRRSFVLLFIVFCFTIFASPVQADLTTNLEGCWKFSGNATDETANGNDLTVNGASLTNNRYSKSNSAYVFDGTNDYLYITDGNQTGLDITGDFSITCWIKVTLPLSADRAIVTRRSANGINGYRVILSDDGDGTDKIIVQYFNNNSAPTDIRTKMEFVHSSSEDSGKWIHLAVTVDVSARTAKIYKNGAPLPTYLETSGPTSVGSNSGTFYIGSDWDTYNFWNGDLDDVRIYSRILTDAEVRRLSTNLDFNGDDSINSSDIGEFAKDLMIELGFE